MILSDNETRIDLLYNEPIAATIVSLIRKQPDRPVTIACTAIGVLVNQAFWK